MSNDRPRNHPCHCGSGRKYKNCCMRSDEAPRYRGLAFTVPEDTLVTGVEIDATGRMRLKSSDRTVPLTNALATEWRRTGEGYKIKSQAVASTDDPVFDPELVVDRSDFVFGVDTNTILVGDRRIHVSCLTCATRTITAEHHEGTIQQIQCIDFDDGDYVAERIGWVIAIESIIRSAPPLESVITLCTDHDLGALAEINSRSQALIPGYYLPDRFRMVYAADKGATVQNKVVKAAHKGATSVVGLIRASVPSPQFVLPFLLRHAGAPNGVRRWRKEDNAHHFKT